MTSVTRSTSTRSQREIEPPRRLPIFQIPGDGGCPKEKAPMKGPLLYPTLSDHVISESLNL